MNRLLLLDGNALIHRAYHALPPLTLASGEPGGAVYGFVSMLLRLSSSFHPEYLAVAFDRPGGTFRNELYENYQAQRPEAEEELVSQIKAIHQVVQDLKIQSYDALGYEADDVIGTLAKHISRQNPEVDQVIIVTGDRDILQLVEDNKILVYMPVKGLSEAILYGEKEVFARLGVKPSLIVDWKGLCGDPSDNYPGIAGIGPKGAADLVNKYGNIENIYKAIDDNSIKITDRVKTKLLGGKAEAFLSKNLATIRTNVPLKFELKDLICPALHSAEANEVIKTLGFSSLAKRAISKEDSYKKPEDSAKTAIKEATNKEQMDLF